VYHGRLNLEEGADLGGVEIERLGYRTPPTPTVLKALMVEGELTLQIAVPQHLLEQFKATAGSELAVHLVAEKDKT
jgi:hypothetical protein